MGIKTVAVYSTADKDSLHVKICRRGRLCIGKPQPAQILTSIFRILWRRPEITNADAIHPGYGFLAENSKFLKYIADHGIKFIGPNARMINSMGDKITAKETMIKAGVPVVPGGEGLLESVWNTQKRCQKEVQLPCDIKGNCPGGGGKVHACGLEESEIEKLQYDGAKTEAAAAF